MVFLVCAALKREYLPNYGVNTSILVNGKDYRQQVTWCGFLDSLIDGVSGHRLYPFHETFWIEDPNFWPNAGKLLKSGKRRNS